MSDSRATMRELLAQSSLRDAEPPPPDLAAAIRHLSEDADGSHLDDGEAELEHTDAALVRTAIGQRLGIAGTPRPAALRPRRATGRIATVLAAAAVAVLVAVGIGAVTQYLRTSDSTAADAALAGDGSLDGRSTSEAREGDISKDGGTAAGLREGTQEIGGCRLYVNSTSFGEDCPATHTAGGRTWRDILAGQEFPRCKVSELPPEIVPPVNPEGADGRWMLHTCLDNVTINGVVPGKKLERRTELAFYPAGTQVPVLTPAQLTVWNSLASAYSTPVVAFGPFQPPRVGLVSGYWLVPGGDDRNRVRRATVTTPTGQTLDTLTITPITGDTNTPLRAYIRETLIWPGRNPGEPALHCPGAGPALPVHTGPAAGQSCTFSYTHSSAHLPDHMYNITIEAVWAVEYQNAAGIWVPLGQTPVTSIFRTPVDEIQTEVTSMRPTDVVALVALMVLLVLVFILLAVRWRRKETTDPAAIRD